MRILLVDDEPEILSVLSKFLSKNGHIPQTTTDPLKVPDLIEAGAFEVIFLDLMMPQLNGLNLIPLIHKRKPDLPIIVMTAVGDTRIAVHAAREGAVEYLLKPLEFSKVLDLLKRLEEHSGP